MVRWRYKGAGGASAPDGESAPGEGCRAERLHRAGAPSGASASGGGAGRSVCAE